MLKYDWCKTDSVHTYDYISSSLSREELYNIEMLERTQAAQAFLMYVENPEIDDSLKWVIFNIVERTSLFVVYAIAVNVRSAGQKKDYELSVQVRASDLPNFRSDTLPNEL